MADSNVRASRAMELAKEHPGHVAAAWPDHRTAVAAEHDWQTTDDDFARALRKALQQSAETECDEARVGPSALPLDSAGVRFTSSKSMAAAGEQSNHNRSWGGY